MRAVCPRCPPCPRCPRCRRIRAPRCPDVSANLHNPPLRLEGRRTMSSDSMKAAANGPTPVAAGRNLASIRPFFIVKDLQASIAYYRERLGFQVDFQGPDDDPYYAGVSRDGIGVMLKAI